jgi:hypothetical protein
LTDREENYQQCNVKQRVIYDHDQQTSWFKFNWIGNQLNSKPKQLKKQKQRENRKNVHAERVLTERKLAGIVGE